MSVAIISSPAKPAAQSAPADNSAVAVQASAGADFARLLLGRLTASATQPIDAQQSLAEKTDDKSLATETGVPDPAAMLAALGLALQEPARKTVADKEAPLAGSATKEQTNALSALQTTLDSQNLKPEAKRNGDASTPFGVDDKPAKFAAPDFALTGLAVPKAEPATTSTLTGDTPLGGLTPLAAPAPNGTEHAVRNNAATLKIETPVRDPSWSSEFGQKVVWLAANDKQSAQLTLNPPHMGPIEISLNLSKDSATAFFVSPNAEVRETIEAAMPRLREMLAGVGIELGQANVGAESFRQQPENQAGRQGSPRWQGDNAILDGDAGRQLSGQMIATQRGNGMVDLFA